MRLSTIKKLLKLDGEDYIFPTLEDDFDHGEEFRKFLKKECYVSKLLRYAEYEGRGDWGIVYSKNGKALKLTADITEINLCEYLQKQNYKHFIKVHSVIKFYNKNNILIGGFIIREFVKETCGMSRYWCLLKDYLCKYQFENKYKNLPFKESYNTAEAKEYIEKRIEERFHKYGTMLDNKDSIYKEIGQIEKHFGLVSLDIHGGNLGLSSDGIFKIFDVSGFKK